MCQNIWGCIQLLVFIIISAIIIIIIAYCIVSLRPLNLLMKLIENYTSMQHHIRVICTTKPLSQSNENLFSKRLKNIFKTITTVPSIDKVLHEI